MPRNMKAYTEGCETRDRIHALAWAAYNRGENPYRDEMADHLGVSITKLAYHIRILSKVNQYPKFKPKSRISPYIIARTDDTLAKIKSYLLECQSIGHLPTNQDIGDNVGINRNSAHAYVKILRKRGDCPPVNLKRGCRVGNHYVAADVSLDDIEAMKREILRERGVIHA